MLAFAVLLCLSLPGLQAQEFRSTLSGLVLDPQGAVIPNVKIQVVETSTGARAEAIAGSTGEYTIPFLAPGSYRLTAEAPGFKRYVQEGIQVGSNQRLTQNITLQIGQIADAVTVTADVTLLSTTSASVGQSITTNQVENMPMNGRTPLVLAQLAFGVTPNADPRFTRPFDNAGPSGFSMGGGQGQTNELLIDGSPDMTRNRRVAYNPPVDTVQEIKVEVFQSDAAYGNTSGGTVNVVMKGGTNEFHGTAYLFNQVSALKATPFFTNAAGQTKPVTRFNQYGITAGGPVLIPRLLNGKNKLFWFFAWEGIKQSEPEPTFSTVPTQAQRGGDFSGLLALGAAYQIYDPLTGVREGTRIRRQPFAGNRIEPSRISPIARNILSYIPLPNAPGAADGSNNYFNNAVRSDDFASYMGRLDYNWSDRHKIFGNFRTNDRLENRGNRFSNIVTGNFLTRINYGATVDDVYTFTPTLVLNTRANWTRFIEGNDRPHAGFDPTSLGLPTYIAGNATKLVFPRIDFGGLYTDFGDSAGDRTPFDSFQLFSALTKIWNRHSFKFGADLRELRESSNSFGNSTGQFNFDRQWTRGPLDNAPNAPIGQDLAALLLGFPTGGHYDVNTARTQKANYYAFFFQDDWRVRQNLTLNLGVRYEYETGTTERFDRTLVGFDPNAQLSITNAARAAYAANPNPLLPASNFNPVGGVIFANSSRRNIYDTYPAAFSPRLGFAWTPGALGGKTVIRGGAGIFYSGIGTFGIQQPGFNQRTPLAADVNQFLSPVATLANPFPDGIRQPVGSAQGVNTFLGQNVTTVAMKVGQPRVWRWTFNIQRELARDVVVEAGYIGSRGSHLPEDTLDVNFFPREFLSTSPVRDNPNINRLTALTPNPFAGLLPGTGLNGTSIAIEQLLRQYPQFSGNGGVRLEARTVGQSIFHMLQTRVEKRFSNGFNLLANFQWSKMIEQTGRLNIQDPFLHRRIAGEDRTLRFVASGSYALPFGRGKAFLSGAGPWTERLIGGWQINAIYNTQSGAPVGWGNVIYYGGDLKWNARGVNDAFDTTRFERNPSLQLDRNLRTFSQAFNTYRSDIINNLDVSIFKDILIVERVSFQLRAESFNATNRTSFNAPDVGPTSGNFGRITSAANLPRTIQLAGRLRW
jgi:hypothetical protein